MEERFRKMVRIILEDLHDETADFRQTCHRCMFLEPLTIDGVLRVLAKAYTEPTAYNISDLSQYLDKFLGDKL